MDGLKGIRGWTGRFRTLDLFSLAGIAAAVFFSFHGILGHYFEYDDWRLLGSGAAKKLLEDPLGSLFGFQGIGHFAPVSELYYDLLSLAFGTDPFFYHLVSLFMGSIAGVLLYLLLRRWGVSPLSALAGSLYFSTTFEIFFVLAWPSLGNYVLCAQFLLLGLLLLEEWLDVGGRGLGWAVAVFVLLGQFTHSLGVVIPLVMGARLFLGPRRANTPGLGKRALIFSGWIGLVLAAQGIPRLFRPDLAAKALGAFQLSPGVVLDGLAQVYGKVFPASLTGFSQGVTFWILVSSISILFLAWVLTRRNPWILALSFLLTLLPMVLVMGTMNMGPGVFWTKMRYLYLPNLGLGMAVAALFDSAGKWMGRVGKAAVVSAQCLFIGLFLVANHSAMDDVLKTCRDNDAFLRQVAEDYRRNLAQILSDSGCGKIEVIDRELTLDRPPGVGSLLLWELDYRTLHEFFFARTPGIADRVHFVRSIQDTDANRPCVYAVSKGRFYVYRPQAKN